MKKILKIVFARPMLVILMLLVQIFLIIGLILTRATQQVMWILELLSLFIVVYVVNRRDKPAYKIAWILLILSVPVFGGLLYLLVTGQSQSGSFRKLVKKNEEAAKRYIPIDRDVIEGFKREYKEHEPQVNYLTNYALFPMYSNTRTEYFSPGEEFFPKYLEVLSSAKSFIFLEFFIIDTSSQMWQDILEILKSKAAQGVEIRVMYDDIGCLGIVPDNYKSRLNNMGIKSVAFNPFIPLWSAVQNNRDHRKITVVDGRVAFTGGINIADEYINRKKRYGYWKDCAVMVEGEAVHSYTAMFLQLWTATLLKHEDFSPYLPPLAESSHNDGYILPYSDTPADEENVCEHVYMQIINNARDYVYIQTPYFIVDDSMLSAFTLAAKSGVDIRIITPGVPDKKLVHMTTRSYYSALIEAGIRVYEYTPGFVHSKVVVSDDDTATVGTANFDFRSLYLHYECGQIMFGSGAVRAIKEDFLKTLEDCREVTKEDTKRNIFVRIGQSILRIIAPLL